MAELAEGARLEIERGLIASVGSNPTLPAIQFRVRSGFDCTSVLLISMQRNDKVGLFKSLSTKTNGKAKNVVNAIFGRGSRNESFVGGELALAA